MIVVCSVLFLSSSAFAEQTREYQIKAEFLERFTRFIEWPADSDVSNVSLPFSICIIGKNPYGSYLKDLAGTLKIQNKTIVLSEASSVEQLGTCNLLFISNSEKSRLNSILNYTREKPILTVSDSPGFGEAGVLINFYETEGYVRFEINTGAVERSRLRFSSRLFKLGRLIQPSDGATGDKNAIP